MKLVALKSHALRWSSLVLLLVLIGAYGWLTQKYHWVFDWTRDNRNSLTEISRTVLEQIDQPLKITVLARNSASERHILRRKIAKYQRYKPDISLQFLDAETAREQARKQHLNNPGQLRLDYQNRFEIVDHI
ncbi:MAG: Gldg family protein, partial [Gammaproteobacteria bacterium]|nr:Gldg family protein [Gammaproteobacteria bacterium]